MWLELQIFGFRALWSPYFLMFVVFIGLLYFLITGPLRYKFGVTEKPTTKQQVFFYTGLVLLYAVKGSPIDLLTHIMLTAHMAQMAIYLIIFPMLIIKGIPAWIWERVLLKPIIKPILKLLTLPIISALLFNALFSLYHIPAIFDYSKSSMVAHTSISIILLIAAFIVWLPILSPIKEFDRMNPLGKIFYIFGNSVLITPACVLIIFSNAPFYEAYSATGAWIQAMSLCVPGDVLSSLTFTISGPEMFSPMSTLEDQQLGGIIMKIMQEITYGVILARVFYGWFNPESHKIDPLPVANATESN
ncbi:cytochrome c oxidase assembly factor CtaG [Ornithinibacillus sp. L9]|uniref:Cytochrome c oxidase assembly factor CtaG n=1 Tax=Ornithinibacillus caprae TaxID=2678566 RepID=A0A6N8FP27_9BACI|nr:cytochrome c oxidase assembly factor CtaG [Ornithinibacillus caprae]MUK89559.1 cytochrome c oxidase assembly factor CtaG [Ornithinibacillus caprae]